MEFPYNSQTYYEFMEQIAINQVDINHNPDRTARKEVSFGEIFISSDPFDKIDISTFMEDIKSKIKFPCMLAVGTDWEGGGNGSQTYKTINASFIILDKEDDTQTDRASKRRVAYTTTERIAEEISGFIKRFFEVNTVFGSLVTMPVGEKIGPVMPGTLYGTKVSFSYTSRYSSLCFDQDQFGLLVPALGTVPDCCTPSSNPDYCEIIKSTLTAQQQQCLQVNVSNSDDSFEVTAPPGSLLELQDITIIVKNLLGDTVASFIRPAAVNVEIVVDVDGTPSGLLINEVDYNIELIDINIEDEIF